MALLGWAKCGLCGNPEASISKTESGSLGFKCHKCQFSGFAKPGTRAARLMMAGLTPDPDFVGPPVPESYGSPAPLSPMLPSKKDKPPKPKPAAPPANPVQPVQPKPAPAANSVFSLADL